jgi:hypothetical protein
MLNFAPREGIDPARVDHKLQRNHLSPVTSKINENSGDVVGVLLVEQDNS